MYPCNCMCIYIICTWFNSHAHSSWRRCFQGSNVSYSFSAQHRWRCGRKGQDETEKSSAQVVCHSSAVSLSWLEATSCRKPCFFFVWLWGKCTKRCGTPRVSRSENYLWRLVYSCLQEGDWGCQWIEGRSVLVLCKILESSSVLGTQSANSKSQCPHWHSVAVNRTKEDYFSGVQQQQGIDPDSIFGRVPRCVTGLRSMVVSGWTIGGPAIPTVIQVISATAASKVMDDVFPESLYQQAACFRHVEAKPCENE